MILGRLRGCGRSCYKMNSIFLIFVVFFFFAVLTLALLHLASGLDYTINVKGTLVLVYSGML